MNENSFCVIFNATVSLYPDSLNLGLTAYETRVRDTIRDFWDQKIINFEFPSVEVYISYITLIELNYVNSDIADNVMTELLVLTSVLSEKYDIIAYSSKCPSESIICELKKGIFFVSHDSLITEDEIEYDIGQALKENMIDILDSYVDFRLNRSLQLDDSNTSPTLQPSSPHQRLVKFLYSLEVSFSGDLSEVLSDITESLLNEIGEFLANIGYITISASSNPRTTSEPGASYLYNKFAKFIT